MRNNKKKLVTTIASLALVGAISIGATLAYLHTNSQEMTNTFTPKDGGKNISIELREPGWDGYNFGELNNGKQPDGKTANPNYSGEKEELGVNEAKAFAIGDVIAKNPQVKNTSGQDVWVAVVVNKADLPEFATIDWENGTAWEIGEKSGDTVIAYYKTVLSAGSVVSAPVFNSVTIGDVELTGNETIPTFDIDVTAYAVQAENIDDLTAAKAAFAAEFDGVFGA